MNNKLIRAGIAAFLLVSAPAVAQVAPNLGTARSFAVLGTNPVPTSGTVTCTDTGPGDAINGNVGSTGASITNSCTINGVVTAPVAAQVVADFNAAFTSVDALNPVCTGVIPIVTTTLAPGVYCSVAGTTIGAGVTITLNGGVNDVFVFRVGTGGLGALTLNSAQFVLAGGAQACNVFFKTAEAVTLTSSITVGTFLAGTAFTQTGGSLIGRGFASTDATVTDPAPLTFAGCAAAPGGGAATVPTLSEWAMILLALLMATAGIAAMRRRRRPA